MKSATLFLDRQSAVLYDEPGEQRTELYRVPLVTNTPAMRMAAAACLFGYALACGYRIAQAEGQTPHLRMAARRYVERFDRIFHSPGDRG